MPRYSRTGKATMNHTWFIASISSWRSCFSASYFATISSFSRLHPWSNSSFSACSSSLSLSYFSNWQKWLGWDGGGFTHKVKEYTETDDISFENKCVFLYVFCFSVNLMNCNLVHWAGGKKRSFHEETFLVQLWSKRTFADLNKKEHFFTI